jgi:peptidoglycan/xylan/chitin deacetylase (PgdA/CDA1 family)
LPEHPKLAINLKINDELQYSIIAELLNQQGVVFERWNNESKQPICIDSSIIEESNVASIFEMLAGVSDRSYMDDKLHSVPMNEFGEKLAGHVKDLCFKQNLPFIRKANWPNFAPACAIITHDIDTLNNPPIGNKLEFMKYAMTRKIKKQPYNDNIDNIKAIEKANNVNASFYFFSGYGKHQAHLKKVLANLDEKDEIALHGSQHSFQSVETLKKEMKELEKNSGARINGIRQHGLNFMVPHTWRYQEKAGFEYDLTHAYNDKFGFRAGTCYPFHPFDSLTKERLKILELPTSFMDWTALHQGLNYSDTMKKIRELCSVVEKHNGVFVSIFHNMYINQNSHPDVTRTFTDTIKYLREKNYWITPASECTRWWKKREEAKLEISFSTNVFTLNSDTALPIEIFYPDGQVKKLNVEAGKRTEIKHD